MPPESVSIRDVTLDDVPAIIEIHADSEGPWKSEETCAAAVQNRLRRPFYCYVAELDGDVVGHAEWTLDRGHDSDSFLYLGMIQIRPDVRGAGIGRRMIEHGQELGRTLRVPRIVTVPEEEAEGFYDRCGFTTIGSVCSTSIPVSVPPQAADRWVDIETVPEDVPGRLPMRIGWAQASSTHMWELSNHPADLPGDPWHHPCVAHSDGDRFVQLRFRPGASALVTASSPQAVSIGKLLDAAHALAARHAVPELYLACNENDCLPDVDWQDRASIIEFPL